MASANSIALQASTAVVVLLFTFAGVMKLIPAVNPSMHAELVGNGVKLGGEFEITVCMFIFILNIEG